MLRHDDHSLWGLIRADYEALMNIDPQKPQTLQRKLDVLTQPGFLAVVIYRLSAKAHRAKLIPVARLLMLVNITLFAVELSPRMVAGPGLTVPHPQTVATGAGVVLGRNVKLLRGAGLGSAGYTDGRPDGFPVVGDGCTIFDGAKIFGPVSIGDGCTIGTGVILMTSLPSGSTVTWRQQHEVTRGAQGREPEAAGG